MTANAQQHNFIQQYISEDLWDIAKKYTIPVNFIQDKSELIELILNSKTLDQPGERQNWIDLLVKMNDEQIERLVDILTKENDKFKQIEAAKQEKKSLKQRIADILILSN